jgi:hypothetical protein
MSQFARVASVLAGRVCQRGREMYAVTVSTDARQRLKAEGSLVRSSSLAIASDSELNALAAAAKRALAEELVAPVPCESWAETVPSCSSAG